MPLPANIRAVVTGAASGLGRALCTEIIERGGRVVAADVNIEGARETIDLARGRDSLAVRCDVAHATDVESIAELCDRKFGGVDLVVNNAGVAVGGQIGEIPLEDWSWIVGVNLWGVIHGCQSFVPRMRRQGSGHVLNVASVAGLVHAPGLGPYNATKAGVVALSETLHGELRGSGVGVSVLCPYFFQTNIARSARVTKKIERQLDEVETVMRKSRVDARDVARIALDACAKDTLFVLPHAEARWGWRVKRLAPEGAVSLLGRLAGRRRT